MDPTPIHADTTVEQLVACPAAAAILIARRMHCVGCDLARFDSLADACRIYGQPLEALLVQLRSLAGSDSTRPEEQTMALQHDPISAEDTMNDVVLRYPHVLPVLTRYGLDTCCGGALSIGEAARHHDLNLADLLAALNGDAGTPAKE